MGWWDRTCTTGQHWTFRVPTGLTATPAQTHWPGPLRLWIPPTEPRVAKFPDPWQAVLVRHRKPGSVVDQPDVEISRDPMPLEVQGKPSMFVVAQESKAPSGVSLAGYDTLGQFLALQRTATEVESNTEPIASEPKLRVLILRLVLALALLAAGAFAVLDAHPG